LTTAQGRKKPSSSTDLYSKIIGVFGTAGSSLFRFS
jgi:hypothetical protein